VTAAKRATRSRLIRIETMLTTRDLAVLQSLASLRLATTNQIERLHFTTGTDLANARACTRCLARLQADGVVAALTRRVGGVRAGSAATIWSLGTAGQYLVTGSGPGGAAIRRPWTPSWPFVAHRLAITELAVHLREAEVTGALEVIQYVAEPACWRRYTGPHGATANLKPDAFAVMSDGQFEDSWFVEMDLGTERPAVIARKRDAYLAYYRNGAEQKRTGVFPWVLFVVPTDARRRVVEGALGKPRTSEPDLFIVATTDQAVGVLAGGTP
jgi:hypothetical protein